MRVVLDTNVIISALFWTGPPHDILKLAETGSFTLAASMPMIEEFYGVLSREKFRPLLERARVTVDIMQERLLALVELYPYDSGIAVIVEDPSDDMFLSCAFAAKASYIVSGDKHLLQLKQWQGTSILTPRRFVSQIQ